MCEEWNRGIYQYKTEFDTQWMLIFQHNTSKGFFKNEGDAKLSLQKERFSIIDRISNDYYVHRYSTNYEFLLEYPVDFPGEYNRWNQTNNPLDKMDYNSTSEITATGFNSIHCDWPNYFGGLMKSHSGKTLLDGRTGSWYWNYAIGDYSKEYSEKTPGPCQENSGTLLVTFVNLWIRISSPFLPDSKCKRRKLRTKLLFSTAFIITIKR